MLLALSLGPWCARAGAESAADRAKLWVLSAGVSRYGDPALDLNFAEADARAVADALQEQQERRVYDSVTTRVLTNEHATREKILTAIRDLIANAGPNDVAAIFLAGHGVRDLLTGTYYFLPYGATRDDFFTRGLRVEELNDMIRILQRHVRHVVLMLDTCHAGAVTTGAPEMSMADDFARQVRAEGVFLLAATRPGDKSKEIPRLQHGVFTYALLSALRGEANAGADGLLSLAELVIYLGLEVPRLTQGQQTPYYLIAGTDLVFADTRQPNSIAVLSFTDEGPPDARHEWMGRTLQESFYFALGAVPVLNRCALQPAASSATESPAKTAQSLGCSKFISGSFVVDGDDVDLRARVVDTTTDADEVTGAVHGKRADFVRLKDQLVRDIVKRMPVVKAYLLMLEAQGVDPDSLPLSPPTPKPNESPSPNRRSAIDDAERQGRRSASSYWDRVTRTFGASVAFAEEPGGAATSLDAQVRSLLDTYRVAHEQKQIEQLAGLWENFSPRQREAMRRYFDQAGNLTLELTDVAIEPHDSEVTVALTRIERFVDRESGKPVRLQIPQRIILTRHENEVKIIRIESR